MKPTNQDIVQNRLMHTMIIPFDTEQNVKGILAKIDTLQDPGGITEARPPASAPITAAARKLAN